MNVHGGVPAPHRGGCGGRDAAALPRARRRHQQGSGRIRSGHRGRPRGRAGDQALILQEFPDHGMLGEEHGVENAGSRHVWVIDPIDGTRAFISGLPVWGTLVGLTVDGDAVAGMMAQPFTGELYYARIRPYYEGPGGPRILRRADRSGWPRRRCSPRRLRSSQGRQARAYDRLEARCASPATAPIATPMPCWRPAMSTSSSSRAAALRHRRADPDHRAGRRRGHDLGRRARRERAATSSPRRRRSCTRRRWRSRTA